MSRRRSWRHSKPIDIVDRDFAHLPFWKDASPLTPPKITDFPNVQFPLQLLLLVFPEFFETSLVAFLEYPIMLIDCEQTECRVAIMHQNGFVEPFHDMGLTALLDTHRFHQRYRVVLMRRHFGSSNVHHANLIIIDTERQLVEWFEPYGLSADIQFIKPWLEFHLPGYEVVTMPLICPVGPQTKIAAVYGDGYCVLFTAWYLVYRMLHPELSSSEILVRMTAGDSQDLWARLVKFYGYISFIDDQTRMKT